MKQYLVTQNELDAFLRYELLYKWRSYSDRIGGATFAEYLLNETCYHPDSEFIQSMCETDAEHEDPVETGVYDDLLPADVARYQASHYKTYEES